MKAIYILIMLFTLQSVNLYADDLTYLQYESLEVVHRYEGKSKEVTIQREIDAECLSLKIVQGTVFDDHIVNNAVSKKCKKTFITTLGTIRPIIIYNLKTIGELEVLDFIERASDKPKKYVLIDARKIEWYLDATIPSAVNIPNTEIKYDKDFQEDFDKLLKTFNIKVIGSPQDAKYDFSEAKTAVVFGNGNWCGQSQKAIKELLNLGYPKEKLIWYRGGMQDWYLLGFTTIRGDIK